MKKIIILTIIFISCNQQSQNNVNIDCINIEERDSLLIVNLEVKTDRELKILDYSNCLNKKIRNISNDYNPKNIIINGIQFDRELILLANESNIWPKYRKELYQSGKFSPNVFVTNLLVKSEYVSPLILVLEQKFNKHYSDLRVEKVLLSGTKEIILDKFIFLKEVKKEIYPISFGQLYLSINE